MVAPIAASYSTPLFPRLHLNKAPLPTLILPLCNFPIPRLRSLHVMASSARSSPAQEKAARLSPVEKIRTLLDHSMRGMLSTFSQKYEGYPSGSMIDFASDANGSPILAISSLAVHSKDLLANPKCSLLVARDPEDSTDLVVTVHGNAVPVSEEDRSAVRTAYLTKHPNAFWVDFGDFSFVRIEPRFVRYVSGVATALLGSGDFSKEEYQAAKADPIAQFSKPVAGCEDTYS